MSWIFFALLSAVFAAAVAVLGKIGLKNLDSTLATTIRSMVMDAFLLIVSLLLGKWRFIEQFNGKAMLFIALSGVAGALSWLCYFLALKNGPAAGVAALDRLSVVFVLILAALFLSEALTLKTGLGALLIFIGAMLFVL